MDSYELTGLGLTPEVAVAQSRSRGSVTLSAHARQLMRESSLAVAEVSLRRHVYGRTTGVGANRDVFTDAPDHGARLLASHSSTSTVAYPADVTRLGVLIRVNQLAAGGSGLRPEIADALIQLLNADGLPTLHRGAAIGTGDLGALAELGLQLGDVVAGTDALPLLSSNAFTLAEACLILVEIEELANVVPIIGAITHVAMGGNAAAYDERVHDARPHPGQRIAAERIRELLAGATLTARRIQDPFGLRAFAQVLGPTIEQLGSLRRSLTVDVNAAGENPLVTHDDVLHNGNWHAMPIALALDSLRLSLHSVATLSTARLANLMDPGYTGLSAFLASGDPASSGVMIIEYVAHDALASVRATAQPSTLGTAVLSRGAEHHASFAPQAVALCGEQADALRTILACELVAGCRAIRLAGTEPAHLLPAQVSAWLASALEALPADLQDRSLARDVGVARRLLTEWGTARPGS